MRSILTGLMLSALALTASAQTKPRSWVQTGAKANVVSCVDQNSIVKNPDGTTRYDSVVVFNTCVVDEDLPIAQNIVDCSRDLSGKTITVTSRLSRMDGSDAMAWSTDDIDSETLGGGAAKFACQQ